MPRSPGLYLHVPYCASICGYCDFNTYVAEPDAAGPRGHVDLLLAEMRLARDLIGGPVGTVFVGGGTPTLLGAGELARLIAGVREVVGLTPDAEVTTEANPESIDARGLALLRDAGYTRISLGMQSAAPHVLATLERGHTPGRAVAAAREAREAGFGHVSLDLIYGTPGESDGDWELSLRMAIDAGVDHISAYALIVESGTRLHAQVRRGLIEPPDDDVLAARYETADRLLAKAGFDWYEISNWSRTTAARCRHNDAYWSGGDWWGAGPGAHGQIAGERFVNLRNPRAWGESLAAGELPIAGRERPDAQARRLELVMLAIRRAEGLELAGLGQRTADAAVQAVADGLLDRDAFGRGRAVLTLRGRLLADRVTLALAA